MIATKEFLPLFSPDIRNEDIEAVTAVLRTGMLVQGSNVEQLEAEIADYCGVKHVVCVSNGTATLHLSLIALGIGHGDEVIIPAFSYIATANVVELVGATPVFVDIDPRTFNIDYKRIEQRITARTKAIMPVHEFGLCADMEKIMGIARKHGLSIIEDAACALGATENGQVAGTFGEFGSFSLHPRKAITSGEGGVLLCANEELANKVRILRNHGIDSRDGEMHFVAAGFNYRMTDFQAALVRSQLHRLNQTLKRKNELAQLYLQNIKNPMLQLPHIPEGKDHSWQTFHITLNNTLDQKKVIQHLRDNGIGSNYGAQCIPAQEFYRSKYKIDSAVTYPNAYAAYTKGVALPLYEKMTENDILRVSRILNQITNTL